MAQEIVARTGLAWASLILLGGVLYSVGAASYAMRWPNPYPKTFGYHGESQIASSAAKLQAYVSEASILHLLQV